MNTTDLTTDILQALVRASDDQKHTALKALRGERIADPDPEPEEYLTLTTMAAMLRVNPLTLWRWRVPSHAFGGRRRYLPSEVTTYLNSDQFKKYLKALRRARREGRNR